MPTVTIEFSKPHASKILEHGDYRLDLAAQVKAIVLAAIGETGQKPPKPRMTKISATGANTTSNGEDRG